MARLGRAQPFKPIIQRGLVTPASTVSGAGTIGLDIAVSGVGASTAAAVGTVGLVIAVAGVGASAAAAVGTVGIAIAVTGFSPSAASGAGTIGLLLTVSGAGAASRAVTRQGFPPVPEILFNEEEHRRKMARAINGLMQGKANVTLDVVVTPSMTTTTITDVRISPFSVISGAMAFDANGAADLAAGIYFNTLNNGSAVMNHRSDASVRTLRLLITG